MRVVLPSEATLPVPESIETVGKLKSHIEKETKILCAVQCLLAGRDELKDAQKLAALPGDMDIDLVIVAGPSYFICRADLRDILETMSGEIFVTHASKLAARDEASFMGGPPANLAWTKRDPIPRQEDSQPYLDAFAKNRSARLGQLRRTRGQLDDGPVVISTFNWGFRDLIANWVASCDRNGIDCRTFSLIFPTDERADAFAKKLSLRTYFDGESYGEQPEEGSKVFGDLRFCRMMFAKIAMTVDMLDVGGEVIRQDVDLVWHRDPRADLVRRAKQHGRDMLFMYDGPNPLHQPLHYNSGFGFIRANPFTRHAWQTVLTNYGRVLAEGGEQRLINAVLNHLEPRGLSTECLPEETYVNGHVIARALRSGGDLPEGSALVHASWTSDLQTKVEHMKKFGLWFL